MTGLTTGSPVISANYSFLFSAESFHDRITIKDGKRNFDNNLTPREGFSGHNASSLTASSNLMWIQFESDFSVNEKGFRLKYEARGKVLGKFKVFLFHSSWARSAALPRSEFFNSQYNTT